jgi:large subunit ribosomal protein L10
MNRTEKAEFITDLNTKVSSSSVVLVAHYKGLTVAEITDLRVKVRNSGAGFKVTKNKLTQLALKNTLFEPISKMFVGPTAIAYSSDPVAAAKVLAEFAKANEKLVLLGGAFGETLLDAPRVVALSKMPSLDELRATIISMIQTPARRIATLLQAPAGQIARVIGAHSRKGSEAA